jgi:TRAP-type C4-dicarboxylate transport system permease small subunit
MSASHQMKHQVEAEMESQKVDISDFKWVDLPGLIFFWALMFVVFLQFFTRYVLNDSLGWTEEIARYLLIMVGFTGAIVAARKCTHIFLEFFYRYLSPKAAKVTCIAAEFISMVCYGYLAWVGSQLAMVTRQNMVSIPLPKAYVYWGVSLALAAMAIYSAVWLVHKIREDGDKLVAEIEEHALTD